MCGIAGIVGPGRRATTELLGRMTRVMAYRGPDGEGYLLSMPGQPATVWYGSPEDAPASAAAVAGFGHRRLSIIDRARGQQPLSNEDGTIWVTYNGELYNYQALRRSLEARGHRFRTNTDTEVIVHQYEEDGTACVEALEGIFAFGIWDAARGRLLLARDRLGVKPLYYAWCGRDLLFASEIKAVAATGLVDQGLDHEALAQYVTFQNLFGDRTLFRAVRLLPPGWLLTYDVAAGTASTQRWWSWSFDPDHSVSLDGWAERVRETFTAVVRRQLIGEVPIGGFLSGGMDTGAIAAVASRALRPFPTFTCGFATDGIAEDEWIFDERDAASTLAGALGTEHHMLVLTAADMWRLTPWVVWHLDEPRVGMTYQNFAVARFARAHVTVAFSGVGGDELFGGYPWRYRAILGMDDPAEFVDTYTRLWNRVVPPEDLPRLFTPEMWRHMRGFHPRAAVEEVLAECPPGAPLHRALWFDAQTFLHGLLVVEDKLSMAHGLEVRTPFTDEWLVDLVRRIPAEGKVTAQEFKVVLKRAMAPLLPAETLQRPKVGFTPPERSWQRSSSEAVRQLVLGPRAIQRGIFQPAYVARMLEAHERGEADHHRLVWSLMCFEWWNRFVQDGEVPSNFSPCEPVEVPT